MTEPTTCRGYHLQASKQMCAVFAHRPVLQGHEQRRAQTRRSELATQARALVKRMRFEAGQGLQYLTAARQRSGSTNLDILDHDPGDTGHLADNLFDRYKPTYCCMQLLQASQHMMMSGLLSWRVQHCTSHLPCEWMARFKQLTSLACNFARN